MISGTYQICHFQNHFAIAQAVCSKSADFRSSRTIPYADRDQFASYVDDAPEELGTITDTYQNTPFSKPCTIYSPGFLLSKSADFGQLKTFPKLRRTIPYAVGNLFSRMWAMFGTVTAAAPESSIFKTMDYSRGFLLKIGRLRSTFRPHTRIF